jgi:hypothetical protein
MARTKNSANGTFDPSNLAISTVQEMPKRHRAGKVNPFVPAVQESYDSKTAMHVVIPAEHQKQVENLIRSAAASLGFGTNLTSELDEKNNRVAIYFRAKDRAARKPRAKKETASA